MLFRETVEKPKNCPQCGYLLAQHFKYSKLIKCQACGSSIFLEDDAVTLIGESSVLSSEPSLIQLHTPFMYGGKHYLPLGKIRYSYGRGFWEEWFLQGEQNQEFWLSIDEGDFVLEEKSIINLPFTTFREFKLGKKYNNYLITEKGEGTCVGFEGELPERINIGDKHQYVHLSKGYNSLITVEFTNTKKETFKGEWIDPLEIKVLTQ